MILLDVNILVYAHREETALRIPGLVDGSPGRPSVWLAAAELVLSGCLRILTHPRVFDPPTPANQAIDFVSSLRSHPNLRILAPGRRHWDIFLELCQRADSRGNLVADAYHAALAIESGREWITTDRDYARFPNLRSPWKGNDAPPALPGILRKNTQAFFFRRQSEAPTHPNISHAVPRSSSSASRMLLPSWIGSREKSDSGTPFRSRMKSELFNLGAA